jgi:hypothetical protein
VTRRYVIAALGTIGAALAGTAPVTLRAAAVVEPFPHAAQLVANASAMAGAFCMHGVLAHSVRPRWSRGEAVVHAVVLLAALAAMTFLLVVRAHPTVEPAPDAMSGSDPAKLAMAAYMAIYVGYIGWSCLRFVQLIHRHSRNAAVPPIVRDALRLTVTAALFGLVWTGWKTAGVVLLLTSGAALPLQDGVAATAGVGAAVMGCAGATMSSWSPVLREIPVRFAVRHAYRTVTPLWTQLISAVPEVRLPEAIDLPATERGEYRLHRRVIEIRDAQLTLRCRIPGQIREWVRSSAEEQRSTDLDVIVEATELAIALDADVDHRPVTVEAQETSSPQPHFESDVLAEAALLARIGHAMGHDPVVAALRARARVGRHHSIDIN